MTHKSAPARTLIVDDEPLARRRLRKILDTHQDIEIIGEATNGTTAVRAILDLKPDLLLLDIQMPGKDGFAVLKEIATIASQSRGTVECPVVIFITAHDEHAVRAFDVEAIDYVLKPITEDRVLAAVRRAMARLGERRRGDLTTEMTRLLDAVDRSRRDGRIAVKSERGVKLVPMTEIQWLEADADLVKIHTVRGTHVHRATMAEMVAQLPGATFARIHRSAIVNIHYITEIQPLFKGDYLIVMKSGAEVRSGRTYRADVQKLMSA